jgi:hypothetical protein
MKFKPICGAFEFKHFGSAATLTAGVDRPIVMRSIASVEIKHFARMNFTSLKREPKFHERDINEFRMNRMDESSKDRPSAIRKSVR